jgi:hypothetical protein
MSGRESLIKALRATLASLEEVFALDANDPALINLKQTILYKIAALESESGQARLPNHESHDQQSNGSSA